MNHLNLFKMLPYQIPRTKIQGNKHVEKLKNNGIVFFKKIEDIKFGRRQKSAISRS